MAVDVYEACLGIPAGKRPPNYYELLGLPIYTAEPPVIAEAVEAAKARLKPFLSSSHAMEAQRLLGELEHARKVLLHSASRKEYEQQLRSGVTASTASAVSQPPAAAATPPAAVAPAVASVMPSAVPALAIPQPAVPPSAVPIQAQPIAAAPVQATPYVAAPVPAALQPAMAVQAVPMQALAVPAGAYPAPAGAYPAAAMFPGAAFPGAAVAAGSVPMAPLANANPLGASFNPNSAAATAVNYKRKKRQQNALIYQLIGASVVVLLGVLIYANWEKIQPSPVYQAPAKPAQVAQVQYNPSAPPDLSRLTGQKPTPADSSATANPTKAISDSSLDEINRKLDRIMATPALPTSLPLDNPTGTTPPTKMPASGSGTPPKSPEPTTSATPTPPTPEPAKPKEGTKADAKEAATIKKQLDEVRAALRTMKLDKAVEGLDLAMLEATADDSNAAIERLKAVVEANQKFWDSAVAGAKQLKALDELKEGDMVVGNVVEVDDKKALIKFEGRNQAVLFATPDKAPMKLLVLCVEKALGTGSEAANLAIGAYLMTDPKGDREQARTRLQAAGAAAAPLLAELDLTAK